MVICEYAGTSCPSRLPGTKRAFSIASTTSASHSGFRLLTTSMPDARPLVSTTNRAITSPSTAFFRAEIGYRINIDPTRTSGGSSTLGGPYAWRSSLRVLSSDGVPDTLAATTGRSTVAGAMTGSGDPVSSASAPDVFCVRTGIASSAISASVSPAPDRFLSAWRSETS